MQFCCQESFDIMEIHFFLRFYTKFKMRPRGDTTAFHWLLSKMLEEILTFKIPNQLHDTLIWLTFVK